MTRKILVISRFLLLVVLVSGFAVCGHAQSSMDAALLSTADLPADCKTIPGEFPVDVQTAVFFQYPDYQKQLLPPLKAKQVQSLDCGGVKGTIYYFAYSSPKDVQSVNSFLRPLLWGGSGPSQLHPELIISGGSVVSIVSFRETPVSLQNSLRKKFGVVTEATGNDSSSAAEPEFKSGSKDFVKGDYGAAEKHFRKAVSADPKNPLAQFYLGESLFRQQKYKDAVGPYEAAARLESEQKRFDQSQRRVLNDQLGMSYGISGDLQKAKAHFEAAIAQDPEYTLYRYNLACAYAEMNDLDNTLLALEGALKRKANVIAGESFPDPRADSSFERYLSNAKFKKLLAQYGY